MTHHPLKEQWHIVKKTIFAVFVIGCLAGCSTVAAERVISHVHNDATVSVTRNETFLVSLIGTPSTGYLWQFRKFNSSILEQIGETGFQSDSELVGASGRQIFRFRAKAPGQAKLSFFYARPWEKAVEPLEEFAVMIRVIGGEKVPSFGR